MFVSRPSTLRNQVCRSRAVPAWHVSLCTRIFLIYIIMSASGAIVFAMGLFREGRMLPGSLLYVCVLGVGGGGDRGFFRFPYIRPV